MRPFAIQIGLALGLPAGDGNMRKRRTMNHPWLLLTITVAVSEGEWR